MSLYIHPPVSLAGNRAMQIKNKFFEFTQPERLQKYKILNRVHI
jgi:hypothetical protein